MRINTGGNLSDFMNIIKVINRLIIEVKNHILKIRSLKMRKERLVCTSIIFLSTHVFADASSDKAMSLLKKATKTLESAKNISVNANATFDEIEPTDDFKIQKMFQMELRFKRPDKLFASKSGHENQKAYFDGSTLTIVEPQQKKFAQEKLSGNIDDLVDRLGKLNIEAPLADLLMSNISDLAEKSVQKARYFGVARINGRLCEHIALRTPVADWQLWIQQGPTATLCKSLITTRSLAQAPQYEVTFSEWKLNAEIADATFEPQIPEGSASVPLAPGTFRYAL